MVNPWEIEGVPFNTESKFWSFVRSGLRSVWSKHPVKIEFVKKYRIKVPNPNPNGRNEESWGMQCSVCSGKFTLPLDGKVRRRIEEATGVPLNSIEINHKTEAGSLKSKEDIGRFASNLLYVTFDDLEPVCKQCHSIVTYMAKNGVSFEQAQVTKQAIQIIKDKQDRQWLIDKGITPASSVPKRRLQIIEELLK